MPSHNVRRPVRVALVATAVAFGGIERVLLNLLENVDDSIELYPILFTRTDSRDTAFFERLAALGVEYAIVHVDTSRFLTLSLIQNVAEVTAIFRAGRFDLIHSHGYRADLFAFMLATLFRVPVVSTCHGFISNTERLRRYNRVNLRILRYFTRVIAVSEPMKRALLAHGISNAKIEVIANAVGAVPQPDIERRRVELRSQLGLSDRDFVFGFVGRLSEEKGVNYLLDAVATLSNGNGSARVLLVGDGPQRGTLEQAAQERCLDRKVTFAGFQSNTSCWYAAMDAFVLPSLTEGTPMALLEAMAHRLPVIATSVGGVPSVVSNQVNGLLVPPADPVHLGDAMRAVHVDSQLRRRLSEGAIRSMQEQYNVHDWADRMTDFYTASVGQIRPC